MQNVINPLATKMCVKANYLIIPSHYNLRLLPSFTGKMGQKLFKRRITSSMFRSTNVPMRYS